MDFVVLDTEGKPELSELAIVDSQGRVIYEAFSKNHPNNTLHLPNLKSLKTLLTEFLTIVQGKKIVCHYAEHDVKVLQSSFRSVGLILPNLEFECTWSRAKNYWLGLESYSLEYLSKYLSLRVNNRYFIRDLAGKRVLPEHIVFETERINYVMGFLQIPPNTTSFTSRISNFSELVCLHPQDRFGLFRDERLTEIKSKVAQERVEQLQNSPNGKFALFTKQDRIYLELTYKLIIDVQNKDLDVDVESALKVFITNHEWYHWLFSIFGFTKPKQIRLTD